MTELVLTVNLFCFQTGSTNDSHHVDSSQTSPVRGLSSDEGSGWKSETTETSEGK